MGDYVVATILYLHGWASSGDSVKSRSLKHVFKSHTVIAPDLSVNPADVVKQITDLKITDYPLIIVGTSLGGFYANYFANMFNAPCFLINPSTNPVNTLENKVGLNKNYATGKTFEFKSEYLNEFAKMDVHCDPSLITLFVAENDNVLDYNLAVEKFTDCNAMYIMEDGGHRFETHWDLVISNIENILN